MEPKNGTCISFAILAEPPDDGAKMKLSLVHFGQTKPLMFSTTPITLTPTFLQKLISFLTSCNDISLGSTSYP